MTITNDVKYIGVNDTKTDLFESQYPIPNGVAYNSYVILDEKIAVMDTVEADFGDEWLENLKNALGTRLPDYLIVQHMEPDHSANIINFINAYPSANIVASKKAIDMIKNFFGTDLSDKSVAVKDGDTLTLGKHTLTFISAPMVHWPEVIVTYDSFDKILFSADAFGKFGVNGSSEPWADEARRYYIGIVGKYGVQVASLLKKLSSYDIRIICSLHGPVLCENLEYYLNLYKTWSSYRPEEEGIVIAYTSIYGNTKRAALLLEKELHNLGYTKTVSYDLARCDVFSAIADAFRFSKLVLATTTYNADIFPPMKSFISHLVSRNYGGRQVAFIENGSWAPVAAKIMRENLSNQKDITFLNEGVKIISALSEENIYEIKQLAINLTK